MARKIFKRLNLVVALIFLAGIFCLIPKTDDKGYDVYSTVSAEETIASGKTWAETVSLNTATSYFVKVENVEDGSIDHPFLIENATDLAGLAYDINYGRDYSGKYFSLEADIDLSGGLWTPIGYDTLYAFNGRFLGNYHTISNITITDESNIYQSEYTGLFGVIKGQVYDLKLAGYYVNTTTSPIIMHKGTLCGYASLSVISNVRDEMTVVGNEEIKTADYIVSCKIFKSGSFDGITADLTTQVAVDKSFTFDVNGSSTIGYLVRYVIKPDHVQKPGETEQKASFGFFKSTGVEILGLDKLRVDDTEGKTWQMLGIQVDGDFNELTVDDTLKKQTTDLARSFQQPKLRENVDTTNITGGSDFYVRFPGYKASIPDLADAEFSEGLIQEITFTAQDPVNVTIDYEYGDRKVMLSIAYDTAFVEIDTSVWADNKVFDRLGYTLHEFANYDGTSRYNDTQSSVYFDAFPIDEETYYFTIDGTKNVANMGKSYLNFLISSEEGGSFSDYDDIYGVINNYSISHVMGLNSDKYAASALEEHANGYPYATLDYASGWNEITITLAKGYQIDTSVIDNSSKEGVAATLNGYAPSGIYLNFANHTGIGTAYTTIDKNNDDYLPVSASVVSTQNNADGTTTYVIRLANHVGGNGSSTGDGEINIVIERKWMRYNITPIWGGDKTNHPAQLSYNMEITSLAGIRNDNSSFALNSNLAYLYYDFALDADTDITYEGSTGSKTSTFIKTTIQDVEEIILEDQVYLYIRYNEYVTITCTLETSNTVIFAVACYPGDTAFVAGLDKEGSFAKLGRIAGCGDMVEQYNREHFKVNQKQSKIDVEYYDEEGNQLTNADHLQNIASKYNGVSININESGAMVNTTGSLVYARESGGKIVANNNAFYRVELIEIYDAESGSKITSQSLAQNGATAPNVWEDMNSITKAYIELLSNKTQYTVKVYLEKVKYSVGVGFSFADEDETDEQLLNAVFSSRPQVYEVGNAATNYGENIWLDWDKRFQVEWTYTTVGERLIGSYYSVVDLLDINSEFIDAFYSFNNGDIYSINECGTPGNWILGFTFNNRKIDLSVTEAVDEECNAISLPTAIDYCVNLEQMIMFKYDSTVTGGIKADAELTSVNVANIYDLTGWYCNGEIYTSYNMLSQAEFVGALIDSSVAGNDPYTGLKAVLKERTINIDYKPTGDNILASDQTSTATTVNLGSFTYVELEQGVALGNDVFYKIGYSFDDWSDEAGKFANVNNLRLAISDFCGYYSSSDSTAWNDFVPATQPTISLCPNFNKISYFISVEGQTAQAVVEDAVNFTARYDGERTASVVYTFGSNTINGLAFAGYDATGFSVESINGAEKNTYSFTSNSYSTTINIEWLEKFAEGYYFEANTVDTPIKINVVKQSAIFKLYIAENTNNYYTVSWDETKDSGNFGGEDATGVYINALYNGNFDNIANALNSGVLTLSRSYFALSGFTYRSETISMTYVSSWSASGTFTATEDVMLTPSWTINSDLSGLLNLTFINGADNSINYRLGTYQDFIEMSVEEGLGDLSAVIFNNGLSVSRFGYKLNGSEITTGQTKFNTCSLNQTGENTISAFVDLEDLLPNSNKSTATSELKITVVQNEFVFNYEENSYVSQYTGTSEVVQLTKNKDIKFAIKYNWKGDQISYTWAEGETGVYNVENFADNYVIAGTDFTVGTGKNLTFTISANGIYCYGSSTNKISSSNINAFFSNATSTLSSAIEIVTKNIPLTLDINFEYVDSATSYTSETISGTITSGSSVFTYTFNVLFKQTTSGEYFAPFGTDVEIQNLVVKDNGGNTVTSNFTHSISEGSKILIGKFKVIYLDIQGSLSYTYNGLVPTNGVVSYASGQYYITLKNDETDLVQVEAWAGYKVSGIKTEFSDEDRALYIDNITFDFSAFTKNVGDYALIVNKIGSGDDEIAVNMSGETIVSVEKREITVSDISKTFDGNADFDSSKENHKITFSGVISGDTVIATGTFKDEDGEDADSVRLAKTITISIDDESAVNYLLTNPNTTGSITPATGTMTSVDDVETDYGMLNKNMDLTSKLYELNHYFTINDIDVNDYVSGWSFNYESFEYSTSGYINAGEYVLTGYIEIPEFVYTDAEGKETNVHVITFKYIVNKVNLTIENSISTITKIYDTTNNLTVGIDENVAESSIFDARGLYSWSPNYDEVLVTGGTYSDKYVGNNKIINLTFGGDDADNYNIISTVLGNITPATFTFHIGQSGATVDTTISYDPENFDAEEVFASLNLPTKTGYSLVGLTYHWYQVGDHPVTVYNIQDLIEEVISLGDYAVYVVTLWEVTRNILTLVFNEEELTVSYNSTQMASGDTIEIAYTDIVDISISAKTGYDAQYSDDGNFSGEIGWYTMGPDVNLSISSFSDNETLTFSVSLYTYIFVLKVHPTQEGVGQIQDGLATQRLTLGQELQLGQTCINDEYIFYRWVDENGNEFAQAGDTSKVIAIDNTPSMEAILTQAQVNGSPITIYAEYDNSRISVTVDISGGKDSGILLFKQQNVTVGSVVGNTSKIVIFDKQQTITIDLNSHKGYSLLSLECFNKEGDELDVGYDGTNIIGDEYVTSEIKSIKIVLEPITYNITVQAGVTISGSTKTPSSLGGKVYLSDANGNLLGDDKYLNVTNFAKGSNYLVRANTDTVVYFVIDANEGFEENLSASGGTAVGNEIRINGSGERVTVYSISGFSSNISVVASFTAETVSVKVSLVTTNGDSMVVENGGYIGISETDTVLANINNTYSVQASAVVGSNLKITAKSRLGYTLYSQSTSYYVIYKVHYANAIESEDYAIPGAEDDWSSTGYSQQVTLTIENLRQNAEIYIVVVPNTYTVNFVNKIGHKEEILGSATIKYNELFSSLAREILYPEAPEEYYSFNGYWTKELSQGTQYLNEKSEASNGWSETGYYFNGAKYVAQQNYNSSSNTFTLYAGWNFKKARLYFNFLPEQKFSATYGYGIRSIILNEDTDNVSDDQKVILWTTQSDAWYGQVYYGSELKVKAPDFAGYEFVRFNVYKKIDEEKDFGEYNRVLIGAYTQQTCTLDAFEDGQYQIELVYYPIFSITIKNVGTEDANGGETWAEQDGKNIGTSGNLDITKKLTLKAKVNEGYNFLYWENAETKQRYYGSIGEEGVYTYTFEDLILSEINFVAVFEGKTVNVAIENSQLLLYHNIISITNNGVALNNPNTTSFNARIGDEIVITIRKNQGYTFAMSGGQFTYTVDGNGNYVFVYKVGLDGVEQVDQESYRLSIVFTVGKEEIKLNLDKILLDDGGSDIKNEFSRIGAIYFIDASGNKMLVESSKMVIINYGERVTLQFAEEDYYKVTQILLTSNGLTVDLASFIDGGRFDITESILETYFAKEISIQVVFERQLWSQVMSTQLLGKGTSNNPFRISSAEDFAYVAYLVNNDMMINGVSAKLAYYKLTNDIDFSGKYWEPIGTKLTPFEGHMDLGKYSLTNIVHCYNYSNPNTTYGGLFWVVSDKAVITRDSASWAVWVAIASAVVVVTLILLLAVVIRKNKKQRYSEYL